MKGGARGLTLALRHRIHAGFLREGAGQDIGVEPDHGASQQPGRVNIDRTGRAHDNPSAPVRSKGGASSSSRLSETQEGSSRCQGFGQA